jgi:hypothetical protein
LDRAPRPRFRRLDDTGRRERKPPKHSQAFRDFSRNRCAFRSKVPGIPPKSPALLPRFSTLSPDKSPESSEHSPGFSQLSPAIPPAFFEASPAFSRRLRQFPLAFAEKPRSIARKSRERYPNIPRNLRRFLARFRRNGEAFPLKSWESVSILDDTHP